MLHKKMVELFYNTKNVYADMQPTKIIQSTILNPAFINSDIVDKIVILSRNIGENQDNSKREWIEKYFQNKKIIYLPVKKTEDKLDILKKNNIDWNVFIDDELPNVRNFAEGTTDLHDKEFLIPKFGYNDNFPQELRFLIESRGGSINYYNPY